MVKRTQKNLRKRKVCALMGSYGKEELRSKKMNGGGLMVDQHLINLLGPHYTANFTLCQQNMSLTF